MKVAHINPGVRGVASYALNVYNYFEKEGETENLIVTSSKWRKQPIPVFEPKSIMIGKSLPWPTNIGEVEDRLLEFNPDILHHHHPSGRLDFHIRRFQKKLDIPTICTVHMSVGSKNIL